ncbi:hypothetical protein AB4K20DRAFT_1022146 [Rhizopus microsporus]
MRPSGLMERKKKKKKKKEEISLLNYQTKKVSTCSLNLAIKRKVSTYSKLSLSGNQTIAYSKNFILLLLHFGFLFFNLNKIYLLNALFFVSDNPRKQRFNDCFICIIMKQFGG